MTTLPMWYEDRENLALLIEYLAYRDEHASCADILGDIVYAMEKPWKYESEFWAAGR